MLRPARKSLNSPVDANFQPRPRKPTATPRERPETRGGQTRKSGIAHLSSHHFPSIRSASPHTHTRIPFPHKIFETPPIRFRPNFSAKGQRQESPGRTRSDMVRAPLPRSADAPLLDLRASGGVRARDVVLRLGFFCFLRFRIRTPPRSSSIRESLLDSSRFPEAGWTNGSGAGNGNGDAAVPGLVFWRRNLVDCRRRRRA